MEAWCLHHLVLNKHECFCFCFVDKTFFLILLYLFVLKLPCFRVEGSSRLPSCLSVCWVLAIPTLMRRNERGARFLRFCHVVRAKELQTEDKKPFALPPCESPTDNRITTPKLWHNRCCRMVLCSRALKGRLGKRISFCHTKTSRCRAAVMAVGARTRPEGWSVYTWHSSTQRVTLWLLKGDDESVVRIVFLGPGAFPVSFARLRESFGCARGTCF